MIAYMALGIALLLSVLLLGRSLAAVDPQALAKGVRYGGGAAALGLMLYLIVSGRGPYVLSTLIIALPIALRWRALRNRLRSASGPRQGRRSEVETPLLRVTLDHATGEMFGMVLAGSFAGRSLAGLSPDELAALLEECAGRDPPSVRLLESYLERRFGADWRSAVGAAPKGGGQGEEAQGSGGRHAGGGPPRPSSAMTRAEALEVLGLEEGASADQVKAAHHRLIARLHPDAGGSAYLAAKLNLARDLLLGD